MAEKKGEAWLHQSFTHYLKIEEKVFLGDEKAKERKGNALWNHAQECGSTSPLILAHWDKF